MDKNDLIAEINRQKAEKNAVILAHLYQLPEVQDAADFVGDSLELAKAAKGTDADVIVFCGVSFMAETAKILNSGKTVLLPEITAGCPMADMVTLGDVRRLKAEHPGAAAVCYVNSSAEVKAECDICCTSSNAVKVVKSLKNDEIIFVPDKNLGRYIAALTPEKHFIFHEGFCPTHNKLTAGDIQAALAARNAARVLVHPECVPEVTALADFTGSTAQIIDYAKNSEAREFIIGTECGILHRLGALCPGKRFYSPFGGLVCPNMKKTRLESVLRALENGEYKIKVDKRIADKAYTAIDKMLSLK